MRYAHRLFLVFMLALAFFVLNLYPCERDSSFTPNSEKQGFQIINKAEKLRLEGNFEKSIELYEKSLYQAQKTPDKTSACKILLKLGLLYWNLGQMDKSREVYSYALTLAQKSSFIKLQSEADTALRIHSLYVEAKKYRSQEQQQKSAECFQQAIDLAQKAGSQDHELKCLRQLSITCWEEGDLKRFHTLNEKALRIAQALNHKKEQGRCLNNIGVYYLKLDNYSKALNYYEKALKIAQYLKNKEEESVCLNNIGLIYRNIGNYEKSLFFLLKSLEIDKKLKKNNYISIDLNNIGEIYRNIGFSSEKIDEKIENFNSALKYFKESIKLARKINYTKIEIKSLNNTGAVYSGLEKYSEALEYFKSAYEKAEEIQDVEAKGMILTNMGIVHFNLGNYEESTKFYQKAIDLGLEIQSGQMLWEAYLELAKAYTKQNNFSKALENYKNSINIIENIRSTLKLEELKASFFGTDKRIDAYHNLISLLVSLHNSHPEKSYDREAFLYMERAKARAFLDSLELSKVNISQGVDFKLQNQEKELMNDISSLYSKLLAAELSPDEKNTIQAELTKKEDQLESLKREIRIKSPTYANLKYPEIITLEDAQKLLGPKTSFFTYCISNEKSLAFALTQETLKIFPVPPKDKLQKMVKQHLMGISDKDNQNFSTGSELFRRLVQPGLEKNIKNIIFIPDDILHILPFETLLQGKTDRWLLEDYRIAYAPSISSLREITARKKSNGKKRPMDILAFGDPYFGSSETEGNGEDIFKNFYRLNYSGVEIERIQSLFKNKKSHLFVRERASEDRLKSHPLSNYKIIHFATHSIIDDKTPSRSSILLSQDTEHVEDGMLQMREIYNLNLNCDLVTLSACETGLGQFIKGEGIEGLNRSFFYAGTSSVLMSLWAVNDQATYQLMERFYTHLRSSYSIMDALREAKLEMLSSRTPLSHPYYWAGFIVSGKADEVVFPKASKKWILLSIPFLLICGAILISIRKKNGKSEFKTLI